MAPPKKLPDELIARGVHSSPTPIVNQLSGSPRVADQLPQQTIVEAPLQPLERHRSTAIDQTLRCAILTTASV